MYKIDYISLFYLITAIWCLCRGAIAIKTKEIVWRYECKLLLIYICIIVIFRFTFFPFSKLNGSVQPLIFDIQKVFPFRINIIPFVNLFDYPESRSDLLINIIGNTAMFIPVGIVLPIVYKKLNSFKRVVLAGMLFSCCIELIQLPFYVRVSDIDDLILNTFGCCVGYCVFRIGLGISNVVKRH